MCIHTCYATMRQNNELTSETNKDDVLMVSPSCLIELFSAQVSNRKQGEFVSMLHTSGRKFNIATLPCSLKEIDSDLFVWKKLTRQKLDPILCDDEKSYAQFYCLELQEYLRFYRSLLGRSTPEMSQSNDLMVHALSLSEECLSAIFKLADTLEHKESGVKSSVLRQGALEILHVAANIISHSSLLKEKPKEIDLCIQRIFDLGSGLGRTFDFIPPSLLKHVFGRSQALRDVLFTPVHDYLDGGYQYLTAMALPLDQALDFLKNDNPEIMCAVLHENVKRLKNLDTIPDDILLAVDKWQSSRYTINYEVLASSQFGREFPLLYLRLFPNATAVTFEIADENRDFLLECLKAIQGNSKIVKLDLTGCPIKDEDLCKLDLPALQGLDVGSTRVSGDFLLKSLLAKNLTSLGLNCCYEFDEENLIKFPGEKLQEIDLLHTYLSREVLFAPFLQSVQRLFLPKIEDINDEDFCQIPCKEVKVLSISNYLVEGSFLKNNKYKNLTHFDVSLNTVISDKAFEEMLSDSLQSLNINGTWVTPQVFTNKKFKHLEDLEFNGFREEDWLKQLNQALGTAGVKKENIQRICGVSYKKFIDVKVAEACYLVREKESIEEQLETAQKLYEKFNSDKLGSAAEQFNQEMSDWFRMRN